MFVVVGAHSLVWARKTKNVFVVENYKSKTINPERSHPTCQVIANLITAILRFSVFTKEFIRAFQCIQSES